MSEKAHYLTTHDFFRLNLACKQIRLAFDDFPYLVGSAGEKPDYRDVDVRLILDDERFDTLFGSDKHLWGFLCYAISGWLKHETGLPVDFQIQRRTEANAKHGRSTGKTRNALGIIDVDKFAGGGDGTKFNEAT